MTKIRIKDTPQAYKDIVEFKYDKGIYLGITQMAMIGKEHEVDLEFEYYYAIGDYHFPKSACEIIHEYKVGDWVEIVDPAGSDFEIGHKGKITAISDNGPNQLITYEIDNDRTYLYGNDIKPCDPPQPNYLEQASNLYKQGDMDGFINTMLDYLKHLESKEVE